MLNKVTLIGRLGKAPDLRYTSTGTPMVTLSIATDESFTDSNGNKVDRAEWHRVVVFQRQAESCATYLGKGSLVFVEGSLQTRKWQTQQGQERCMTEIKAHKIQFLDRKRDYASPTDNSHLEPSNTPQPGEIYGGVEDFDRVFGEFPITASEMDKIPF